MKKILALNFILCISLLCLSQEEYLGVWKLTDTEGDEFLLQLNSDQSVESTYNKGKNRYYPEIGFWRMNGTDAQIIFNNGWMDVIRKAGDGYEKTAYKPGEKSGKSSVAMKTELKSIWENTDENMFVGVWELKDESEKKFYLKINEDYTAQSTYAEGKFGVFGEIGIWRMESNRIMISYNSGWVDIITHSSGKYYKVAFAPGQRLNTKPQNMSEAEKIK